MTFKTLFWFTYGTIWFVSYIIYSAKKSLPTGRTLNAAEVVASVLVSLLVCLIVAGCFWIGWPR